MSNDPRRRDSRGHVIPPERNCSVLITSIGYRGHFSLTTGNVSSKWLSTTNNVDCPTKQNRDKFHVSLSPNWDSLWCEYINIIYILWNIALSNICIHIYALSSTILSRMSYTDNNNLTNVIYNVINYGINYVINDIICNDPTM